VTGLSSRRTFLQIGDREFTTARRDGRSLALFCFDLDQFRRINDRWGHHVGDELLVHLRQLLDRLRREQDFAGRLGDGEFALLLPGIDDERALALAERLRREVGVLPGPHRHSDVTLHISGGLTSLGPSDRSFSDLLRRADRALQLAKANGRDQIACLFDGR
jgi:diguanylate cyclase (GGDEF)-like protein